MGILSFGLSFGLTVTLRNKKQDQKVKKTNTQQKVSVFQGGQTIREPLPVPLKKYNCKPYLI